MQVRSGPLHRFHTLVGEFIFRIPCLRYHTRMSTVLVGKYAVKLTFENISDEDCAICKDRRAKFSKGNYMKVLCLCVSLFACTS